MHIHSLLLSGELIKIFLVSVKLLRKLVIFQFYCNCQKVFIAPVKLQVTIKSHQNANQNTLVTCKITKLIFDTYHCQNILGSCQINNILDHKNILQLPIVKLTDNCDNHQQIAGNCQVLRTVFLLSITLLTANKFYKL